MDGCGGAEYVWVSSDEVYESSGECDAGCGGSVGDAYGTLSSMRDRVIKLSICM